MKKLIAIVVLSSVAVLPSLSYAINCSSYDLWSSAGTYVGGDVVKHRNIAYKSNWWNQGQSPEARSGSWQEWSVLGNCDGNITNIAPTANANGPYSAMISTGIRFSSAGSEDTDGSIASFSWSFGDGATSSEANPNHSYSGAGTFTVTLTVTDNRGASTTVSSVTTVTDNNNPGGAGSCEGLPSYVAGTTYANGDHVINRVNASGETVEYECVIGGWCSSSAAWAYEPGNGLYWTDAWKEIGVCTGTGGNQKPIAQANGPYSGLVNQAVNFSSSGSSDPDGTITGYSWNFGDGATSTQANPSHSFTTVGTYTTTLTVTDNQGASTMDSAVVTIADNNGNQPPTAKANGPYNAKPNTVINFSSTGSNDPDGTINAYRWDFGDGNSSTQANPTHSYASDGSYTVTLTVTDNNGASASDTTTATISGGGTPNPGPLPHRVLVGYWHNFINGAGYLPMADVDTSWDIINASFAENARNGAPGEVAFAPAEESEQSFRAAVKAHQARGKKVLISLGGANAHIKLESTAARDNFVRTMGAIIADYGFDGIDIDLEGGSLNMNAGDTIANPKTPAIVNLIAATRSLKARFGTNFVLTMAPETAYVQGGFSTFSGIWGAYLPLIDALRDDLTLLHVQHYNSGSITGADGRTYSPATVDFHVALSDMMITGFPAGGNQNNYFRGLRADQIGFGLPATTQAAGSGFTGVSLVQAALDCLIKKQRCSSYVPANAHGDFRGLMTWSINWDTFNNQSFSKPHRAYLNNNP